MRATSIRPAFLHSWHTARPRAEPSPAPPASIAIPIIVMASHCSRPSSPLSSSDGIGSLARTQTSRRNWRISALKKSSTFLKIAAHARSRLDAALAKGFRHSLAHLVFLVLRHRRTPQADIAARPILAQRRAADARTGAPCVFRDEGHQRAWVDRCHSRNSPKADNCPTTLCARSRQFAVLRLRRLGRVRRTYPATGFWNKVPEGRHDHDRGEKGLYLQHSTSRLEAE